MKQHNSKTTLPTRRGVLCAALLLALGGPLQAQRNIIPLYTKAGTTRKLSLDLDRLWGYNLYERSRWTLGLRYRTEWKNTAGHYDEYTGYVGYGVHDQQLKGGLGATLYRGHWTLFAAASRDYSPAASRRMDDYHRITDVGGWSHFMTRRMSDNINLAAGLGYDRDYHGLSADVHLFFGGRLFDGSGLLYRKDGDSIGTENGVEATLLYTYGNKLKTMLVVGHTWPDGKPIVRLLAQYERWHHCRVLRLGYHLQAGATTRNVPYIRMFDLGGSSGSPVFFRNCLLTIAPNEYTSNLFALASVRVETNKPLFNLCFDAVALSVAPRPFVGVNAAWGLLWGQDGDGCLAYEGLALRAPHRGVAEAMAGVDNLVQFGMVDWGVAYAWQFLPEAGASAWLVTAAVSL